jgi:hypothetical protein
VAQARASRGPGELEALGTGFEPGDPTGIVSGLSLTRSETPMNTGRPVSVGTDTRAPVPNRVPKQDAVSTIRELVNRLFAGDLDGETRTRTGDTTIFSRAVEPSSGREILEDKWVCADETPASDSRNLHPYRRNSGDGRPPIAFLRPRS